MNIGGLGARAALLQNQKHTKPCERCGLHSAFEDNKLCPHCSSLDEAGLKKLMAKKEQNYQGRSNLGKWFIMAALALGFLMLLSLGA